MKKIILLLAVVAIAVLVVILFNKRNVGVDMKINNSGVEVVLETPFPDAIIQSPLFIKGKAKGSWYFEASFPVKIIDVNGAELGKSHAEAESDWMIADFVPFHATVTFKNSPTKTGFLVLENDNTSGLPEKEKRVEIPIKFSAGN